MPTNREPNGGKNGDENYSGAARKLNAFLASELTPELTEFPRTRGTGREVVNPFIFFGSGHSSSGHLLDELRFGTPLPVRIRKVIQEYLPSQFKSALFFFPR
ncbi:MAG: hypothetical protein ACRD18_16100 [Terriglobia bacterium]